MTNLKIERGELDDVPDWHTANPEEAFAGGPATLCAAVAAVAMSIHLSPKRRDEIAEERTSRYVHEDGTPK